MMREVSPTARRRIDLGRTTMRVVGPATTAICDATAVATPVTDARTVATPAIVPVVTWVDATPDASVVADDGLTVAEPVAEKETRTPDTGAPVASTTSTEKVPPGAPATTLGVGGVTTSRRVGVPSLAPVPDDESDPHPTTNDSAANAAATEIRITWS
jgi:hypothetical protein